MKRSEMKKKIREILDNHYDKDEYFNFNHDVAEFLLKIVEEQGMLPPTCTVRIIPDTSPRGGFKHSETKREWDEE